MLPRIRTSPSDVALIAAAMLAVPFAPAASPGQEAGHDHAAGPGHHHGIHFTHPLFAESVSPDRKVRVNYGYFDLPGDEEEHSARLGLEYAFDRAFSVEASFPYSLTDGAAGITSVTLKFANFALEEHGVLLGYGIGAGIPTAGGQAGDDGHTHPDDEHGVLRAVPARIPDPALDGGGGAVHPTLGREHWELSPFFNLGVKHGAWELVGFGTLGIPTDDVPEEDRGVSVSFNASALYHAGSRVDFLAELHGRGGIQGHPVGEDVINVAPGIRWRMLPDRPLVLGLGASFPVSDARDSDARLLASLFYHFGG